MSSDREREGEREQERKRAIRQELVQSKCINAEIKTW